MWPVKKKKAWIKKHAIVKHCQKDQKTHQRSQKQVLNLKQVYSLQLKGVSHQGRVLEKVQHLHTRMKDTWEKNKPWLWQLKDAYKKIRFKLLQWTCYRSRELAWHEPSGLQQCSWNWKEWWVMQLRNRSSDAHQLTMGLPQGSQLVPSLHCTHHAGSWQIWPRMGSAMCSHCQMTDSKKTKSTKDAAKVMQHWLAKITLCCQDAIPYQSKESKDTVLHSYQQSSTQSNSNSHIWSVAV